MTDPHLQAAAESVALSDDAWWEQSIPRQDRALFAAWRAVRAWLASVGVDAVLMNDVAEECAAQAYQCGPDYPSFAPAARELRDAILAVEQHWAKEDHGD